MSFDPTVVQQQAARSAAAAGLIHEAKLKEHEAACLLRNVQEIERARIAAMAAAEAVLDAKELLYRIFTSPV